MITVCFSAGEKKFIYPDAFSNFLILKNADAQKKVQHLLDVREEERETELKELQEQQEKKHMLENLKLSRLLQGRAPDPGALAAQLHVSADGTPQGLFRDGAAHRRRIHGGG